MVGTNVFRSYKREGKRRGRERGRKQKEGREGEKEGTHHNYMYILIVPMYVYVIILHLCPVDRNCIKQPLKSSDKSLIVLNTKSLNNLSHSNSNAIRCSSHSFSRP